MKHSCLFFTLYLLVTAFGLRSQQWQPTYGPGGNTPWDIKEINGSLFLAADWGNYRSDNGGQNWIRLDLPAPQYGGSITSFWPIDQKIYFRNYVSSDGGNSWMLTGNTDAAIIRYAKVASAIVALSEYAGPYYSTDGGVTWQDMKRNLPQARRAGLSVIGAKIYVALADQGIYETALTDAAWQAVAGNPPYNYAITMETDGTALYLGTATGIYRYSGTSWSSLNNNELAGTNVFGIRLTQDELYIATYKGLFRTNLSSVNWQRIPDDIGTSVHALWLSGNSLYAGFEQRGLCKSTDMGASWHLLNKGIYAGHIVNQLSCSQGKVWSGSFYYHLLNSSADMGQTWKHMRFNYQVWWPTGIMTCIYANGDDLYMGEVNGYIYYSHDGAVTWHMSDSAMFNNEHRYAQRFLAFGDAVFMIHHSTLFKSVNRGQTWTAVSGVSGTVTDMEIHGGELFLLCQHAGGQFTVYNTSDGQSWSAGYTFTTYSTARLASGVHDLYIYYDAMILRSGDAGNSWAPVDLSGLPGTVFGCAAVADRLYLAVFSRGGHGELIPFGIYKLANGWEQSNAGLEQLTVNCLASDGNFLYAGIDYDGVYRMPLNSTALEPGPASSQQVAFVVYPNPGSGIFEIKTSSETHAQLRVFDAAGHCVYAGVVTGRSCKIDLGARAKGIYIVELVSGNDRHAKKIVLD